MTVNPPNIKCYVQPPGKGQFNYAGYVDYSGLTITQNFGRQGDTATFVLIDPNYSTGLPPNLNVAPTFTIPTFSRIKLIDQNAITHYASVGDLDPTERATIFSGYVSTSSLSIDSPNQVSWNLSCVDYSGYANASIVQANFDGIHMGDAVVYLVNKANCGIKAATVPNGGYVQLGPTIPRTIIHYTNLSQGLQRISNMASGQSAYGWYVDSNLNLHFYDQQQAADSGVIVVDDPTISGMLSYTECHIQHGTLQYEFDGSTMVNRALCVGTSRTHSTNTKSTPTESFTANGHEISWLMKFVPYSGSNLRCTINGVQQTVSLDDGTTTPTTQYVIKQFSSGVFALTVNTKYAPVPKANTIIKLWYEYRITVTGMADLKKSQTMIGGPNKGIFAKVVNQSTIQTTTGAHQRATRELAEFGHPQERLSFTTSPEWIGVWIAGQTFTLYSKFLLDSQRNFAPGLIGTFIITQQTINFVEGGFRSCQIQAVRVL